MIELQRKLLGDKVRNDAFFAALKKVIKKGETDVLDLGSGTGFLGFLASRLGAKHTVMIESGEIFAIAEKLAKRNAIKNCTLVSGHSAEWRTKQKFDVIVSETLGNYALEENIIESMEDAKRFLKPGGIMIPAKITQFVCPVVSSRLTRDIDIWNDVGFDLAFDEARTMTMNNMYVKTLKKDDLLAGETAVKQWDDIDFAKKNKSVRTAKVSWDAPETTTIEGFALWWDAELIPGITVSTSPLAPITHWEQIYLPLLAPIELKKNETATLTLQSDTRWHVKINLTWAAEHLDARGKTVSVQKLDMRAGYLN